jgi:hypothetical protein
MDQKYQDLHSAPGHEPMVGLTGSPPDQGRVGARLTHAALERLGR